MRRILAALLPLSLLAAPAYALTATQTVEKETVVRAPDGTETRIRETAERASPGERLVYTVSFTNDGAEPASNLVMTQPVPEEVRFIEGSADQAGMEVRVSVDGGESFVPRGAATVVREGEVVRAEADDITHIRWQIPGPVAVGETGRVTYKAVLE